MKKEHLKNLEPLVMPECVFDRLKNPQYQKWIFSTKEINTDDYSDRYNIYSHDINSIPAGFHNCLTVPVKFLKKKKSETLSLDEVRAFLYLFSFKKWQEDYSNIDWNEWNW